MSLLTIVQDACGRMALPQPAAVATSSDPQTLQMYALLNEEGRKLSTGESVGMSVDWSSMTRQANFSALAAEVQGDLETLAPGFKFIVGGSMYNRTLRRPVPGPLTPAAWQLLKAANVVGPYPQWRIAQGQIWMLPNPNAGDSIYFEFQSKYWAESSGGTLKARFSADDDVALLDEELLTMGLVWRFKKAKGFDYAEDYRDYQTSVTNAIGREKSAPVLNLGDPEYRPGVLLIPEAPGITPAP